MIPIEITETAITAAKRMYNSKLLDSHYGLRIGIKGSGCAGISYVIGFDEKKDSDKVFHKEGLAIYIEKKDFIHLAGMKVDYIEDNSKMGFTFVTL